MGNTQEIPQGEGGEQGDPLMPMLFSLGEHPALGAIQRRLQDDEKLLAYLDDVTVVCQPDRVCAVIAIVAEELARHSAHRLCSVRSSAVGRQISRAGDVVPPDSPDRQHASVLALAVHVRGNEDEFLASCSSEQT